MKVALVHELLTLRGGAERVLRVLADLFPDAPIHTLLYDEARLGDWFPRERVRPSAPLRGRPLDHHLSLARFPAAVEAWDFSEYDLVLSSSSAFAHGIVTNSRPPHLCYVHSPARYLWDRTHDVMERACRGPLGGLRRAYLERLFHRLRVWDSEAADRADVLLAASDAVRRRIQLYWRRESETVHPPLDDQWLSVPPRSGSADGGYYLVVSTLAAYKRIDVAIRACNDLGIRLIVAGTGPAERELRSLAGPTVEFAGHQEDAALRELYQGAKATLFPGDEDFGLVPLESLACGTPVVALRAGGALETVRDAQTGVFADRCEPASFAEAIRRLDGLAPDPAVCAASARGFSRERFTEKILAAADRTVRLSPAAART